MSDKIITCIGCGEDFTFTEGEQGFLRGKFGSDFAPPKRCKSCRKLKKVPIDAHSPDKMHVWILIGAIGSGKSAYLEKRARSFGGAECVRVLCGDPPPRYFPGDVVIISADDITLDEQGEFHVGKLGQAHSLCMRVFTEILQMGGDRPSLVIVENTNTSPWELAPYIATSMAYGEEVELKIIALMTHWQQCVKRANRITPSYVIRAQSRRLERMMDEWPTYWPRPEMVLSWK